jgi:4-hydroxy 2-oxovalerate aldolase
MLLNVDKDLKLYDVTLRDGNHAIRHQLSADFVKKYCIAADKSGAWAIEVGHGNGLGASSYLVGQALESDYKLLATARENLKQTKLAIHAIPGFATITKDLAPAIDLGVDIFRIATHATEADTSQSHIEYLKSRDKTVHGVLMMNHVLGVSELALQVKTMINFGAEAVILMDSAGHLLPSDCKERVGALVEEFGIEIGMHAHNNLGVAASNATAAFKAGARIIDGASMGLGAGAGNAQLEIIVALFERIGFTDKSALKFLPASQIVNTSYQDNLPRLTPSSIMSGMYGVFSGYAPFVEALANKYQIELGHLWAAISEANLVAGQESILIEIAQSLAAKKGSKHSFGKDINE